MRRKELFSRTRAWFIVRGVFIAGSLFLIGYFLFFSPICAISHVVCDTPEHSCSDDIIAELDRSIGKNIFSIKPLDIERRLQRADLMIEQADVSVGFPNTLRARIKLRIPYVQLLASFEAKEAFLVDSTGMIIGSADRNASFQQIYWKEVSGDAIGQLLPDKILQAIDLVVATKEIMHSPLTPVVEGNILTIKDGDGTNIRFGLEKSGAVQIQALQVLIKQARIENTVYKTIDMRFEHPVVTR